VAEANTQPGQSNRAALLAVDGVAELLACSSRSVYRLSDSGRMPRPLKIGGMVRWSAAAVREWIDSGCPDCRAAELNAARIAKASTKNPSGPLARRG
jgi:prophage regulatory protein